MISWTVCVWEEGQIIGRFSKPFEEYPKEGRVITVSRYDTPEGKIEGGNYRIVSVDQSANAITISRN